MTTTTAEFYPITDIIDFLYNLLSADTGINTREINGTPFSTNFYKYVSLSEIANEENRYKCPAIAFPYANLRPQRQKGTSERIIKPQLWLEVVTAGYDLIQIKKDSYQFSEDIEQLIYNSGLSGNLRIFVDDIFPVGKHKHNEIYEYAHFLPLRIDYR